jgi:hypothetical protein
LLPGRLVHADLTPTTTLAASDDDRSTAAAEVRLVQRERLVDPKAGTPEHDDERPQAAAVRLSPAARITATISWTVGGSAG